MNFGVCVQSYQLAFEFVSYHIDELLTIVLTILRGLAIVLAEDVPAIAKTTPPSNFILIVFQRNFLLT